MAPKGKRFSFKKGKGAPFQISSLLIWRVVVVLAAFSCVGAAAALWFSGGGETEQALKEGRRLVVTIKTGEIEGNLIKSEDDKPPEEPVEPAAPDEKPTPDEAAGTDEKKDTPVEPAAPEPSEPETPEQTPDAAEPPKEPEKPEPVEGPDAAVPTEMPKISEAPKTAISLPDGQQGPLPDTGNAPQPLTYEQLPQVSNPAQQSSVPAVLPSTASAPPLMNTPIPEIAPAKQKIAKLNKLLLEETKEGKVPMIAADGTKAWKYYSRPYAKSSRSPMVAIVITGLGHNTQVLQHAIGLPEDISLAFSPYTKDIAHWEKSVRLSGHEMLLELPLEPVDYPSTDPGPYGLMLGQGISENKKRLRQMMAKLPSSVGFITPYNEKYSRSDEDFKLLLKALGNHGVMLVVPQEPFSEATRDVLNETSTPNVIGDVFIDEELNPAVIQSRLHMLEQLAKKKGYAIGIAHPYPVTIAQLKEWVAKLKEKGVVLVPITAIAKLDYS